MNWFIKLLMLIHKGKRHDYEWFIKLLILIYKEPDHKTPPTINAEIKYSNSELFIDKFDTAYASPNSVALFGTDKNEQQWVFYIYNYGNLESGELNEETGLGCTIFRSDKDNNDVMERHWHGSLKFSYTGNKIIAFSLIGRTSDKEDIFEATAHIDLYPDGKTK